MFVVESGGAITACVMAGYEGHRGNVYYLAVHPDHRQSGIGKALMEHVEQELTNLGCPKINLMVRHDNADARHFYEAIGYEEQDVTVFGKRLISDC